MKKFLLGSLASASALALGVHATAAQPAPAGPAAADAATLGEVVVTARRRSESLQEVPQTVNAVTSETLQKLNITQFQDVQAVVPGLQLQQLGSGFTATASLRGISYDGTSTPYPSVAEYINDAPVQAPGTFQALFDIGQIEILKGPQGTTRGVSAPSGAITITTHKPDLSSFGGYFDGTLTDLQGRNAQGAINIPLIKDVLALRVAGVIDENDFDGVRSIHSNLRPHAVTAAERVSLSFEPSDVFNANITYQHLDRNERTFQQITGPGAGTVVNPPISADQRAAVQDAPTSFRQHFDLVTAQVDSRILGQHLSYVGSYQFFKINQATEQDQGNVLPGASLFQNTFSASTITTQEVRVASDPAPGRFFDYVVGGFYTWTSAPVSVTNPGPLEPGAFGTGATPNVAAFNPAYQIPILIEGPGTTQETSLFGNITLHLGANTELSGGIRHIAAINNSHLKIELGNGLINLGGLPCSLVGLPAGSLPGSCVIPTGGTVISNFSNRTSERPNIYNVSLSHHLTRNFLVYANTGTAFRGPNAIIGIQGELANSSNPVLSGLGFHPPETSRSYEVGFKSTFLDERARLNVALYRQRFHNLSFQAPGINYFNTATNAVSNFDFTADVDALVQGIDVDGALQVTRDWNISAQYSYAHNQIEGSLVPCNVTGANGKPVFNTGDAANPALISMCPGGSASRLPLWNLTVQSEYAHPVTEGVDGFVRGLFNYYPQNKYIEPTFAADAYSLLNLYAGVRSHDGAWELSLFARNALFNKTELDQATVQYNLASSLGNFPTLNQQSGYYRTLFTPRREVGVHLHYAWGSR